MTISDSLFSKGQTLYLPIPEHARCEWEPAQLQLKLLKHTSRTPAVQFPQFQIGFQSSDITFSDDQIVALATVVYNRHYNKQYSYTVERVVDSNSIKQIELYRNSTKVLTVSDDRIDSGKQTTEETVTSFPNQFWNGVAEANEIAVSSLEGTINSHTVSEDTIRIPVLQSLSTAQAEIVVHLSRLLVRLYQNNYVLTDTNVLGEVIYGAYGRSGYSGNISTAKLSYPGTQLDVETPDFIQTWIEETDVEIDSN